MLISSLDPRVARRMFGKLARAVLDLEPSDAPGAAAAYGAAGPARRPRRRRHPARLPRPRPGRVAVPAARHRDRRARSCCRPRSRGSTCRRSATPPCVPLLDAQLQEREASRGTGARQNTLARHARELMRVDAAGKHFARVRGVRSRDGPDAVDDARQHPRRRAGDRPRRHAADVPLASDLSSSRIPKRSTASCDRSFALLRGARARVARCGAAARGCRPTATRRPAVGVPARRRRRDQRRTSRAFCTPERAVWLADLALVRARWPCAAGAVVDAVGPAVVAPLVELLESIAVEQGGVTDAAARGPFGRPAADRPRGASRAGASRRCSSGRLGSRRGARCCACSARRDPATRR